MSTNTRSLSFITHSIQGGLAFRRSDAASDGDVPVIQGRDLDPDGLRIRGNELARFPIVPKIERFAVQSKDILFLSRGMRKCAVVVEDDHGGAVVSSHIFIVRANPELALPDYIAWWLNHPVTQARLESTAKGSRVPFVSLKDFRTLTLPVPSLEVQKKIFTIDQLARAERALAEQRRIVRDELIHGQTYEVAMGYMAGGAA